MQDGDRPLSSHEVTLQIQKEATEKAEIVTIENEGMLYLTASSYWKTCRQRSKICNLAIGKVKTSQRTTDLSYTTCAMLHQYRSLYLNKYRSRQCSLGLANGHDGLKAL